jgi:hypothetical protein
MKMIKFATIPLEQHCVKVRVDRRLYKIRFNFCQGLMAEIHLMCTFNKRRKERKELFFENGMYSI